MLPVLASAKNLLPQPQFYKVIFDHRFPASREFGAEMEKLGATVHGIHGDITDLWFHDLYHRWKQSPVPTAGMTAHGPLFCLERLAWDHGMRVLYRTDSEPPDQLDYRTQMKLPPGVKSKDFADAMKQFEEAVGKQWVFTSDEDVALYKDAYSPFWGEEEERVASAAVAPDSVEQVQKVARVANALKIPIYPISTGRNLGYGGSAPNLSGSVVLDLKRMNRVLEVSERNAWALVEPGVSYFDLSTGTFRTRATSFG
jgi:hypothetical protein